MIFVIGGAFQGKTSYVCERYGLTEEEIFCCTEAGEIELSVKCVDDIQEFTLWTVRNGVDPVEFFQARREEWRDSILVCQDIFCGVVPLGADMRAWRDQTGRLAGYLSREAESVVRIFCGLPQVLK